MVRDCEICKIINYENDKKEFLLRLRVSSWSAMGQVLL